jgi:hypothetical protein
MYSKQTDSSFITEQAARDYAAQQTSASRSRLYIILTADKYFVTATKDVQPYEKLIASFVNGMAGK